MPWTSAGTLISSAARGGQSSIYYRCLKTLCKQPRHSPSESFWVATSRPKMPFGSASAYVLPVTGQNRSSDDLEGLLTQYIIIPAVLNIFPLYATVLIWVILQMKCFYGIRGIKPAFFLLRHVTNKYRFTEPCVQMCHYAHPKGSSPLTCIIVSFYMAGIIKAHRLLEF